MRKLLVALLALGLVFAFTAPAFATDASFSGYYRLRGFWQDNTALVDDEVTANNKNSNAWYDQRLRVQMVFNVAEGLSVTGRFHALDRKWGVIETANVTRSDDTTTDNAANIYWHRAYMTFKTAIGKFDIGYQSGGTWGTVFSDTEADGRARIKYTGVFGPVIALALTEKLKETDYNNNNVDKDYDSYAVAGIYKWDAGQAGLLLYILNNKMSDTAKQLRYLWSPYMKANFGPLYLEAEVDYVMGSMDYDSGAGDDFDYDGWAWYLYGKFNMGPAYVGAQYAFAAGDDPDTDDSEAAYALGSDYNPCLIIWNDNLPGLGTYATTNDLMSNASLYQIFAGFSPMEKLTLHASITYLVADETATDQDDKIGYEYDIEATYKIFDNLEYWIGFGYLQAGDWWKGANEDNEIDDTWLIMHKLQMNF